MASTFPSLVLAAPNASPDCARACRGDRILGIGLAALAAPLTVRSIHLDHRDALPEKMSRQPSAVAAGALDTDELDVTETSQPTERPPVAARTGLELLNAQERPTL